MFWTVTEAKHSQPISFFVASFIDKVTKREKKKEKRKRKEEKKKREKERKRERKKKHFNGEIVWVCLCKAYGRQRRHNQTRGEAHEKKRSTVTRFTNNILFYLFRP